VLHSAAQNVTLPSRLGAENTQRVPHVALWLPMLAIQGFLVVTRFAAQAFTLALKMTSAMTLLPCLLVAAYGFKLAWTGESYTGEPGARSKNRIIGALATFCAAAMLLAGGPKFLLRAALPYAPGTLLHVAARREQGLVLFSVRDRLLFGVLCVAAGAALVALLIGALGI
jgi:arginine:ornithine antiporter / lysine permease